MTKKREAIDPSLLDELLAGRDPKTVLSTEGLLGELEKALTERILNAEMDHHPSDEAATKLIWLVLRNVQDKWIKPPIAWHKAMSQFAIHFQDRFIVST